MEFVWYLDLSRVWVVQPAAQRDSPVVLRYIDWGSARRSCSAPSCSRWPFSKTIARAAPPLRRSLAIPILIVLDWAMLALGAFVETRPDWIKNWSEPARVAILGVGTLPFIGAFVLLFWLLGNDLYSDEGFWLLIITFVIWLLYGIVAAIAVAPAASTKTLQ